MIGAVTDGREEDEEGVVDALVRELRGTPYRHLRAVAARHGGEGKPARAQRRRGGPAAWWRPPRQGIASIPRLAGVSPA